MQTALLNFAAAASALAFAAPASAQYYPRPAPHGYGYGYGHQNNYGHVRSLAARVNWLQRHVAMLDNRDIITEREARRLHREARDIERRLFRASRYGLNPREAYTIQRRIQLLEYRINRDTRDGRRWSRYGYRG